MENNQSAARAAKRFLQERVRNDWDWPNTPECWSETDEEARNATELRERYYGTTTPEPESASSSTDANPYKFDNPDSIGDAVLLKKEARKRKRREAQEEELQWNEGLADFVARRDVWTGVAAVKRYEAKRKFQTTPAETSPAVQTPPTSTLETSAENDPSDPLIPVAPRLLADNPIRASIKPRAYGDIYNNIVGSARSPSVPVNLADMTKALVHGWKESGNELEYSIERHEEAGNAGVENEESLVENEKVELRTLRDLGHIRNWEILPDTSYFIDGLYVPRTVISEMARRGLRGAISAADSLLGPICTRRTTARIPTLQREIYLLEELSASGAIEFPDMRLDTSIIIDGKFHLTRRAIQTRGIHGAWILAGGDPRAMARRRFPILAPWADPNPPFPWANAPPWVNPLFWPTPALPFPPEHASPVEPLVDWRSLPLDVQFNPENEPSDPREWASWDYERQQQGLRVIDDMGFEGASELLDSYEGRHSGPRPFGHAEPTAGLHSDSLPSFLPITSPSSVPSGSRRPVSGRSPTIIQNQVEMRL